MIKLESVKAFPTIRAMLWARVTALGLAAVAFWCGCQTPRPLTAVAVEEAMAIAPAAPLTSSRSPSANGIDPLASSLSHRMGEGVRRTGEGSAKPMLATHHWPAEWNNTWVPLENWSRFNRLQPARLIATEPHRTYQLQTANGPMAIKVGTRLANCDGLQWWLGFAPQMIRGVPCLHWLDAQKNLQAVAGRGVPTAPPSVRSAGFSRSGGSGSGRTVVIDPGHGGTDSGALSAYNGAQEKDYNFDWAVRLSHLLRSNGWTVVLTRTRDTEVSLQERVNIADRAQADLFLSLHFNSAGANRELSGIETYCLTPAGMPSSLIRDSEDDLDQVFPNNRFDAQNLQLALRVHRHLVRATAAADRGVRRARFMGVLRGQTRPAVLIEAGYLSNPEEARMIAAAQYRQQLAQAVAAALVVDERDLVEP